ncbi:DUF4974 domain-containing protein [candidate division KSB1 bacterium]|nr:DUF4974 domain-containing protein [candidate division KSB1 bacterium]NIR70164.1 DUF4974 domain-containing protein [candidate division KSB1 bacterium]NIT74403.1 DUF4974 domain-containing protein [candidate division KSB1 bacterium]NIU28268.1 DUF4974 domain-containing protein [candidate division KSB1 bacterium]NIU91169.1 DUF4974 domain-containing protein [candidate division KSB1 bacterium]
MHDLNSLLENEPFQRWLSGNASAQEAQKWENWLNESEENRQLYQTALKFWRSVQFRIDSVSDVDEEWSKLSKRLKVGQTTSGRAPAFSGGPLLRARRQRKDAWIRFVAVAFATVVLIALIARYVPFQDRDELGEETDYQLVSTEYGQRVKIKLPEGTEIILNANSKLKYPAVWSRSTSHRFDLQGEAYFAVTPSSGVQFEKFFVHTVDGTIKVTGTRFAVYERGQGTRVVVEEGGVEVSSEDTKTVNPDTFATASLTSGQMLRFGKGTRVLSPRKINIQPYVTWWKNQMILDETPFEDIVQRLEETYGVVVKVSDKRLVKKTLSGSIENENLVVVTDALANALMVSVQRDRQVITFGKPSTPE